MIDEQYMEKLILEDKMMCHFKRSFKNTWKVRKYIDGYKRQYMICRNGLVYNKAKETWLKPQQHKNGYLYVVLYFEGKRKNVYLHRLIAEYYSPNPYKFDCAFHADQDKLNNRASNIWWTSRSLLQRTLNPDITPTMANLPDKRRKDKGSTRVRKIPTKYERSLQVMENRLRSMKWESEERESYGQLVKEFREDVAKGLPIPLLT